MSGLHSDNIVEIRGVTYEYAGQTVLKDIDLDIHYGDYLGLVGPNGSGKTTLVRLILGLIKPTSGTISVRAKSVGYVAQKATNIDPLFPVTVFDVASMGNSPKPAREALKEVDMWKYQDRLIGELSGGQQQRVIIGRALSQRAEIIFLDEPTSGVDAESQKHFYKLLSKLNKEKKITLVLISHDIEVISNEVTELVCLNQTLDYHGDPMEFIKNGELIHHHH